MLGCVLRSACSCAAASAATAVARHDCCVVVVDHVVAVAATLVFTVASDCCAAASAAAVVARHARRYFFFKHQADVSSTGIDLHASVQTLLLLLSLLLLLPLWFLLSFLIVVLLLQLLSTNPVCQPGFSLFSHYLLQYSCTLDGAQCEPCCSTVAPSMARHTVSSEGDTPILIQTWFSSKCFRI